MHHPDPVLRRLLDVLPERLRALVATDEPMSRHTTLRVGGPADLFLRASDADDVAEAVQAAQRCRAPWFLLGGGSNVCVSDLGVRGLVILNAARQCEVGIVTRVDTGHSLMGLFQKSAAGSLSGLEFAVGIPGTVGGALVSNAGAYQSNIGPLVTELDVVECGERKLVGPEWMEFSYRDSRLRKTGMPPAVVVRVSLRLAEGDRSRILSEAGSYQRQRIAKQPWYPSAGSFFKNVTDAALAQRVEGLPAELRRKGIVPAGYLSAQCGCKGLRVGHAEISPRHANFVVNRGGATATDIRAVAETVKARVRERFGVELQEEVLYVGDWQARTDDGR